MHHNTICAHCAAALAVQILAHSPAIAAQSTADDLALLLCSLLDYTLTSLLCTSCSFLQHAAQRHSRATLPVRRAFGKRSRARVPLRHRAPFATYMAGASRPQWHHPHADRSMIKIDNVFGTCPRRLRADHLPRLDLDARPEYVCMVLCRAFRASSDPLRPAHPQTARGISNLLLAAHNVSHRVRHRPGRLKSPTEAPPPHASLGDGLRGPVKNAMGPSLFYRNTPSGHHEDCDLLAARCEPSTAACATP